MNCFIFGGSGFIGTHLVDAIAAACPDATVYNLDIVKTTHGGKSVHILCDVRREISSDGIAPTANDVIFNLAAVHRTPGHPDFDYFETNIRGAENVCAFAERYGIRKIAFTSSIAPYGAAEELKEETTLPTPNTPYGISKLVAEEIHRIWQARDNENRQLLILRPGVVFGKGENGNFTRLYKGIRNRTFFYAGRRDTVKACMYVKELTRFMLYRLDARRGETELYNCTFEPAYTIEQIAETIKKVTGLQRRILKINGTLLIFVASVFGVLGFKKFGIHPARVKKLMISTNISGKRLAASSYRFKYTFEESIRDWYSDNDNKSLE
ncbi:MAG: NAD(P)-dependent oxidoreductase [Prevotellaceae bacterium]|jgi:nucleoside-diphosphate-sugar epimerase|nr:NAD(P)-dependent oxidoreductase [Prevotellaceae bacterium]